MTADTTTVVARYLALGGAHVTVDYGGKDACEHSYDRYPYRRHSFRLDVACEACGPVRGECADGRLKPEEAAVTRLLSVAQEHAQVCRRIPERLWPDAQVTE